MKLERDSHLFPLPVKKSLHVFLHSPDPQKLSGKMLWLSLKIRRKISHLNQKFTASCYCANQRLNQITTTFTWIHSKHFVKANIESKARGLLYSLVNDFKRISPSMHVDKVKPLIGFNRIISCKIKPHTKTKSFRFFWTWWFSTFLPPTLNSFNLIH